MWEPLRCLYDNTAVNVARDIIESEILLISITKIVKNHFPRIIPQITRIPFHIKD